MKHKYFVAFDYWDRNNTHGVANAVIERELPVSGLDDILNMTEVIRSCSLNYTNVVISNWRRLEDSE